MDLQYVVLIAVMVILVVLAAAVAVVRFVSFGTAKTPRQPSPDITQSLFDGSSGGIDRLVVELKCNNEL